MAAEISITLPLSMFGDRSIDEVIAGIKDAEALRAQRDQLDQLNMALKGDLVGVATDLVNIINHDEDVMWKFSALRQLSQSINQRVRETTGEAISSEPR